MPSETEIDAADTEADALFRLHRKCIRKPLGWIVHQLLERSRDDLWCVMQDAEDREPRDPP